MNTYSIVKVFGTIQGEGGLAGTPATFVRLGGCNMWSGIEAHRDRDAERNTAECPRWCDTDFRPRARLHASDIVELIKGTGDRPLVVLTGGEPLLQVDDELITALHQVNARIQIETNGTVEPQFGIRPRVYITLSPKVPRHMTKLQAADELKLVYPAYDPADWASFPTRQRFIQPQADREERDLDHERAAIEYVQQNPSWRLSLQQHKIMGIP